MRILIVPDSFKGSAGALRVASHIEYGWQSIRPGDEIHSLPLADGGEGTLECIHRLKGGELFTSLVLGPDSQNVSASWLLLDDGSAIIELAQSSGLGLMSYKDPLRAHTYGFGQLIRNAMENKATKKIVLALGGSASTDGGSGALRALGYKFLDANEVELPLGGRYLQDLSSIDGSDALLPPQGGVLLLTDVSNPLLGVTGAAQIFAPQKGATVQEVELLESALSQFAEITYGDVEVPGSGSAGGTAYGLATLWSAEITSGSEYVTSLFNMSTLIDQADLVITGEGAIDSQTWDGKIVGRIAHLCKTAGKPLIAVVGVNNLGQSDEIEQIISLSELAGSSLLAIDEVEKWLFSAGALAAKKFSR